MRTSDEERARYEAATPRSRALHQEATKYLPGGETRTSTYWAPYPITIARGEGCHVWDVDGTRRLDFFNNFTTLVLGHNHPAVTRALQQQLASGTSFFGATESQVKLARLLCERVPSLERVRFANSGTEATLNAVRAARAFTGRSKVAKCEGGYHGTHEALAVSISPVLSQAGRADRPANVPADPGLPQSVVDNVVVLPFNDVSAARRLITEHCGELAAVIVEPVLGNSGMIPATPEYLAMLREVTTQHGILLAFDEVVTLQVARGGAQEHYGVTPDITTLGKIIGGGMPVGAFGGRRDVMALYDQSNSGPHLGHAGTFNGHPLAMAAGLAVLEQLTPGAYRQLHRLGDELRRQVTALAGELEVPLQVTGLGSLFALHMTDRPVRSYRDSAAVDPEARGRVFLGLLNEGIFLSPRLLGCVSTAIGETELDQFVSALRRVLVRNFR